MTEITCINTGSSGNGFLLKSADQTLVLELGCKFRNYVKELEANDKDYPQWATKLMEENYRIKL